MERKSRVHDVVSLWDAAAVRSLFVELKLAAIPECHESEMLPATTPAANVDVVNLTVSDKMMCLTCGIEFIERDMQREHYKSDWHRFNLKRKLRAEPLVTEDSFEQLTSTGDLSSISGSDTETDEADEDAVAMTPMAPGEGWDEETGGHIEGIGKRHPRVFFRNKSGELFSIYRCVIHGKKTAPSSRPELLQMTQTLPEQCHWAVFMSAGGHFAAAIFNGSEVVVHKTIHRYVVRAKRGTVQSVQDKKGAAPKSGGATIRRYNEAALAQEIHDLVDAWDTSLAACSHIFMRCASSSRQFFFGGKSPAFGKKDARIHMVPFQTRRPTFSEVKRVHHVLTSIECYGSESVISDHIMSSPKKSGVDKRNIENGINDQKKALPALKSLSPEEPTKGDSGTDSDGETELVTRLQTVDLTELQPFEVMARRPRHHAKRPHKPKRGAGPEDTSERAASEEADGQTTILDMDPLADVRNKLYTACKTGDLDLLRAAIMELNTDLPSDNSNSTEAPPEGTSSEDAGCDCGVDRVPVTEGTMTALNLTFGAQQVSLLHVASRSGHSQVVSALLHAGVDPATKDLAGNLSYLMAADKRTRDEYRRFLAQHPDRYNYGLAQIQGPLTADVERERRQKEAERRRVQKKARREKQKVGKAQEQQTKKEEADRQRFLALSDRDKRAIAAERRLAAQRMEITEAPSSTRRCFQCGDDLASSVPFEYNDNKFCTTRCLQAHRRGGAAPS